ncbi:TauD/TfdA family dioxygenase (plasmid) [Glutamicibacter sp. FR1]|uniref:TauD/TfdA family dioxygenase n=1 Tax=Glutamicibacter sp. FR1 TaxID=3393744 RepID=UPI0039AEEFF8
MIVRIDGTNQATDTLQQCIRDAMETHGKSAALHVRTSLAMTPEELSRLFNSLETDFGYEGGNTPRRQLSGAVVSATELPPEFPISAHNELSYGRTWPTRVYFGCENPPNSGGETYLVSGESLLSQLPKAIRLAFVEKNLVYMRTLHSGHGLGRSWQETYQTENANELSARLRSEGSDFSWHEDYLTVRQKGPAVLDDPTKNGSVWFNQAEQWHPSSLPLDVHEVLLETLGDERKFPQYAEFGDGTEIPNEWLEEIRSLALSLAEPVQWSAGDLLIFDNRVHLHGRYAFTGQRRVHAALAV